MIPAEPVILEVEIKPETVSTITAGFEATKVKTYPCTCGELAEEYRPGEYRCPKCQHGYSVM